MGREIGGNSFEVGIGIGVLDCESGEMGDRVFGRWEKIEERGGMLVSFVSQTKIHLTCCWEKRKSRFLRSESNSLDFGY